METTDNIRKLIHKGTLNSRLMEIANEASKEISSFDFLLDSGFTLQIRQNGDGQSYRAEIERWGERGSSYFRGTGVTWMEAVRDIAMKYALSTKDSVENESNPAPTAPA